MAWPNIPDLIYTDEVRVRVASWGVDAEGGRAPTYSAWSGVSWDCSVSAANADDIQSHSRESLQVTHVVTSNNRLGGVRDQLRWEETGAVLSIIAIEPAGDRTGRIWNHYCEEYSTK